MERDRTGTFAEVTTVDELRLQMLEAAAPEALRHHHAAWAVALSYATALMTPAQRRRWGAFVASILREGVEG